MTNLLFTINAIGPVFLIIMLGAALKRGGFLKEDFIRDSTKLVFKVSLPALLFSQIASTDFTQLFEPPLVILGIICTIVMFFLATGLSLFIKDPAARGPFIQGSFRGNIAIIGFAVMLNVLGDEGLTKSAILLSFMLPLFNILSVIALTVSLHRGTPGTGRRIFINIITNPLILAVIAALPFSLLKISLPEVLLNSLTYLSRISLPLALLGIGGTLTFRSLRFHAPASLAAAFLKLILMPGLTGTGAYLLGYRGVSLAMVILFFGCPTAISTFVMARSMDNDHNLAANIIVITTLGSMITLGIGIYVMASLGIIQPL